MHPSLVAAHVLGLGAENTSEEARDVGDVAVIGIRNPFHIFIGLVGRCLHHFAITIFGLAVGTSVFVAEHAVADFGLRAPLLIYRHVVVARPFRIFFHHQLLSEASTVKQRSFAILLAIEVRTEGEHVVGRVLVHRRFRTGADEQQGITRIAHENEKYTQNGYVEQSHRHLLAESEQVHNQATDKQ